MVAIRSIVISFVMQSLMPGLLVPIPPCRFSFPSIFVVYTVIAFGVVEVCLLSGYTDRISLFCTSRDLAQSVVHETRFCTVQGIQYSFYHLFGFLSVGLVFGLNNLQRSQAIVSKFVFFYNYKTVWLRLHHSTCVFHIIIISCRY